MACFQSIPTELRLVIIEQVLSDCRTPPATPSKLDKVDFQDIAYKAWRSRTKIYNEKRSKHCPSNAFGLLLTNHQISAETRAVLKTEASKLPCILDISALNDYDLFPTWLSVPQITNRFHTVQVNVRLFGHILSATTAESLLGSGGRLGFHWSFYALLERFLRYGPVDEKKPNAARLSEDSSSGRALAQRSSHRDLNYEDRDVTIERLILHFQSAETQLPFPPENFDVAKWNMRIRGLDRAFNRNNAAPDELRGYCTRPEWLASHLRDEIQGLLCMTYHTAEYGTILYERIGTIQFIVNGETTEIDLAGELARLRFTAPEDTFGHIWPRERRIATFWDWKRRTLERRKQLGYPVVWPQDPELEPIQRVTK